MSDLPKVLIVVNGGVADYVFDGAVEVEIFDWDDYKENHESSRVSAEFAALARLAQVPYEGDESDD